MRHVEEVTGNVAMTCRYFGISRPTDYTWLHRYETEGVDSLRERSRRPRTSPTATRAEVVEKIIHLRQHYHFGPDKIRMYLERYHNVQISKSGALVQDWCGWVASTGLSAHAGRNHLRPMPASNRRTLRPSACPSAPACVVRRER